MMRPTETRESRAFVLEMKFLISPACADEIRAWARGHMLPDPHAGGEGGDSYRVTSLYLDTPDLAVYERRGSYARSKYRVRRYGDSGLVFLERKLKTRNRVGKLRSVVPVEELAWLQDGEAPRGWAGRWFQDRVRLRNLRPVCQISYRRTARLGVTEGGPIRLTVDEGLVASPADGYRFQALDGATALLPEQRILELKYKREIPGLFKELMQTFNLRPQAASKYRMAVESLGLRQEAMCLSS